jgi:hypothetical protein
MRIMKEIIVEKDSDVDEILVKLDRHSLILWCVGNHQKSDVECFEIFLKNGRVVVWLKNGGMMNLNVDKCWMKWVSSFIHP